MALTTKTRRCLVLRKRRLHWSLHTNSFLPTAKLRALLLQGRIAQCILLLRREHRIPLQLLLHEGVHVSLPLLHGRQHRHAVLRLHAHA